MKINTLLSTPRSIPFLIAVFMNAFVDLGHKIVIQNTVFKMLDGPEQVILTAIVNGLILLPFILLFSPAGFVSDRFPKHQVMRVSAWAAVVLTSGITLCYWMGWFWIAFAMTFLLAMQSAFYSPAKYGYLKNFFGKSRLAEANGLVQAISIIAILAGTFVFSILFEYWFPSEATSKGPVLQAIMPVGFLLMLNSVIELVMMYQLPNVDNNNESESGNGSMFSFKQYLTGQSLHKNLILVLQRRGIRLAIIGLTMFWSVGQVMLAAFPAFAKESLGELNTIVIQGILAATGIGIALGSMIAGRVSKNYIETGLIPVGAIGIALGLWILPSLASPLSLSINFLWIGVMGGFFIIPLNALIQYYAHSDDMGKTLAANNFVQNVGMLFFLIVTVLFSLAGIASQQLLQLIAVVALVGGIYTVVKLPQSLVRFVLTFLMSRRYKVAVQGMPNVPQTGGVLLLGNHISYVDWAIIQIACPRPVQFVMEKSIYERWYLRWFLQLFNCIPIQAGASSKASLEIVAERLNQGQVICLFPEGLLSRTGHLAEFRKGYEKAAQLAQHSKEQPTVIVPFYLRGLWGSQFSRSSQHLKQERSQGLSREVVVAFSQALSKDTPADMLKRRVFDLSITSWTEYVETLPSINDAWIRSVKRQKIPFSMVDAQTSIALSPCKALAAATAFSRRIKQQSSEQNVGLLVPTSVGGMLANMAGLLAGKTIVNLNYTASITALSAAIEQADIRTLYTSARFIKKLNDRGIDLTEITQSLNVIYLEELKENMGRIEMLIRFTLVKCLPVSWLTKIFSAQVNTQQTAAILFSSGSEGLPKGVQLSHQNIMANVKQVADVLNTQKDDRVMASLPLFHAFGLTVTQFMPLIEGLPIVCHPDPTDVANIAKAIGKHRVTVMCGTSTFLRLYCRNKKVHPLMLQSLRVVVSGAEKLQQEVRESFKLKFGKDIYEGYGATETSPVASVNLPDAIDQQARVQKGSKIGTVGMPLPGTSFKIVDPQTFNELTTGEQGMILIGGVQVMQGYLNAPEKNQQAIKLIDGLRWYVTGDKGYIDDDGYLTIVDRYSRFAKIGGEMISLGEVEQRVKEALSALQNNDGDIIEVVAVNIPDAKKGESIVLLSEILIDLAELKQEMIKQKCNPLLIPSDSFQMPQLPILGSGKTDFSQAKTMAVGLTVNFKQTPEKIT